MKCNEPMALRITLLEQQLEREAEQNRHMEKDRVLMSLLHCWNADATRSLALLEDLGCVPVGEDFIVLQLVSPPAQAGSSDVQEIYAAHFLATQLMEQLALEGDLVLHTHDADAYYCILNAGPGHGDLTAEMEQYAGRILSKIEDVCFLTMQANVSIPVQGLRNVSRAYRSLEKIQEYRTFLLDETPCLAYSNIADRFTDVCGCQAPEKHLIYALRTHNYEEARDYLQEFFHELFVENRPGVTSLASQFYRLVNPMLDMVSEMLSDVAIDSEEWQQLRDCQTQLLQVYCLSDLRRQAGHVVDVLEAIHRKKQNGADPRWMNQLLELIERDYRDPQLSVSSLAEAINITAVHMSRVFRQLRGMGVMDYVHQMRIQAAKELLCRGESVKSVSSQVGYASQITMTRAFKKYDGQTPGYYIPVHSMANCGGKSIDRRKQYGCYSGVSGGALGGSADYQESHG